MLPENEFDALVTRALRRIPPRFRKHLENVAIIVEREPPRPGLLGLYQGHPLTTRSVGNSFTLPDKITISRVPMSGWRGIRRSWSRWSRIPCGMRSRITSAWTRRACGGPRESAACSDSLLHNRFTDFGAESLLDAIARNLAAGVTWIQIREKDLSARALFELVEAALRLPNPHGVEDYREHARRRGPGCRSSWSRRCSFTLGIARGAHLARDRARVS